MQYGVTCIVSNEVGQSEYMADGKDGFVFESEKTEELAERLMRCFSDWEETRKIGMKGRKIYEEYFSQTSMKKNIKEIIDSL